MHIFQNILGNKFSTNWLVEQLSSQKNIYEIVKNDERLIGILLGYGEESATAFYQAINSDKGVPEHTSFYCPVEAKASWKKCRLFPIVIMGNPNSNEVQGLVSKYGQELDEFWPIYREHDSLELFLRCICSQLSSTKAESL